MSAAPLAEETGHVDRAPAEVRRALVAMFSDGYLRVEERDDLVAVQGGWWYRGEYHLAPEGDGTRITHRVLNVATRGRWAVPLANRFFVGFRERTREGFAGTLRALSR
ncbi:hypothetical protein [Actinomadura kijaniata]|uniref:hypothetical protein n=1 Tax=Actinomadura kijaniata TaxID=46161 RepID=UPI000829B5B7|nr:hypothetical protein [Actinomadura kijaniata]